MHSKRIAAIFVLLLMLGGVVLASGHQIVFDPSKNLYHFWIESTTDEVYDLKYTKSVDQGYIFGQTQTLYSYTQEVAQFDTHIDHNKYFLSFIEGGALYLASSTDFGKTFSPPLLVSEKARHPSLAIIDDSILLAWEDDDTIKIATSESKANILFAEPSTLTITDEVLSSPRLITGDSIKISFLSSDPKTGLHKIIYSNLDGSNSDIVYQSLDGLVGLRIQETADGLIFLWKKSYFERYETHLRFYFGEKILGKARIIPAEEEPLAILFREEKPLLVTTNEVGLSFEEINYFRPAAPKIISPAPNRAVNLSNTQLIIETAVDEALLCKIELSPEVNFTASQTTRYYLLCTQETNAFKLPAGLPDGTYYLQASVSDGLFASQFSDPVEFIIDNLPPEISALETQQSLGKVTFQGEISEPGAFITINNQPVSFESDTQFVSTFGLSSEINLFTFTLSDEAGNLNILTEEVTYNAASPEITVEKPEPADWYKPGSTILIEASVFDLQEDIEDATEAQVTINGQILDDTLGYDAEEKSLFGFITLPEDTQDGEHTASINLTDQAGNQGGTTFTVKIDTSPPIFAADGECFGNSNDKINLPIVDQGAGVDPGGTIIKIMGSSFEGEVSVEAQSITLIPTYPLLEGSYEVEVYPRDMIGNTGEATSFSLVIDTTPPKLSVPDTYETQTSQSKITLQAQIEDDYPVTVNIYNNQKTILSEPLEGPDYSKEINLFHGENDIKIEAVDQAGNISSANLEVFSSSAMGSSLISNCSHGPNPFSPTRRLPGAYSTHGNGMVFSYSLSQPADVKIMIYDITGTLIWIKEIQNSASGVTAWNGVDQFGKMAGNGIYPYLFLAKSGGVTETRRSKIIVYHQ
jgi:hypothetical protein